MANAYDKPKGYDAKQEKLRKMKLNGVSRPVPKPEEAMGKARVETAKLVDSKQHPEG